MGAPEMEDAAGGASEALLSLDSPELQLGLAKTGERRPVSGYSIWQSDSVRRETPMFRTRSLANSIINLSLFAILATLCIFAFAIEPAHAQTLTTLYSFTGKADGGNPYFADLIMDGKGNLYGTAFSGGNQGLGVVYRVTPAGKEDVLYSFESAVGCFIYAGVIADPSGHLYGTAGGCGANGFGSVYEVAGVGTAQALHSFTGSPDGAQPFGALLRDSAGNLYGTTNEGGVTDCFGVGCGTVFELTPAGVESVMSSFGGIYGENPVGALVSDTKGNFYGTTGQDGSSCCGTVFQLTPSGSETTLFDFDGDDGSGPGPNRLVLAGGHLYGTTSVGASGDGTVFEIIGKSSERVLHSFSGLDGMNPYGGVIRDAQGNLYGTTFGGAGTGCNDVGCGTVYEISASGVFTTLYTFTGGNDGGNPAGGLVMDKDGNLYGTTYGYGAHGFGTVFKLTP
jgi:uncharacterized repeat protein (TIGR03803 family)